METKKRSINVNRKKRREFYEFESAQLRLTQILQAGKFLCFPDGIIIYEGYQGAEKMINTAKARTILKQLAKKEGIQID